MPYLGRDSYLDEGEPHGKHCWCDRCLYWKGVYEDEAYDVIKEKENYNEEIENK